MLELNSAFNVIWWCLKVFSVVCFVVWWINQYLYMTSVKVNQNLTDLNVAV